MSMMYDSRIPQSAVPVARETLALSDAARGLPGYDASERGHDQPGHRFCVLHARNMVTAGQMEEQMALAGQQISIKICKPLLLKPLLQHVEWSLLRSAEMNDAHYKAQRMLNDKLATT